MRAERADRAVLQAYRLGWSVRGSARTTADRAYLVYLLFLTAAVVAFPLIRALLIGFQEPSILGALTRPGVEGVVAVVGGALAVAVLLLGPVRGPAVTSPFVLATLGSNHVPRRFTLRRAWGWAVLACVSAVLGPAAVAGAAVVLAGRSGVLDLVLWLGGVAGFGLVLATAWTWSQAASIRARRVALLACLALVVIVPLRGVPGVLAPWGWVAATWPGTGAAPSQSARAAIVLVLVTLGATGILAVRRRLDALDGEQLRAQAHRWQAAQTAAAAGDIASSLQGYRARPGTGRRLRAVRGRGFVTATCWSDVVAILRTPARAGVGLVGLAAAGWLLAGLSPTGAPGGGTDLGALSLALGVLAGVLAHAGTGALADGLRQATLGLAVPRLLGVSDTRAVAAHAVAPTALALLAVGLGASGRMLTLPGGGGLTPWVVASLVALLAPLVVLVRLRDAAKGPPPPELSLPVPSPIGDVSAFGLLAWQADAVLIAGLTGFALVQAVVAGSPLWALVLIGLPVLLVRTWRSRVDAL